MTDKDLDREIQQRDLGRDGEHERRVQEFIKAERARRDGKRRLDAEERGAVVLPTLGTLGDLLASSQLETMFRIAGWLPSGGRVVFVAPFKTGKTILIGNLIRSLADGDPFLGKYAVVPVDGTVALLDFEMIKPQLAAWLRAQGIRADSRVIVEPMKTHGVATFDILNPQVRAAWAARLRQLRVAFLIIDCLRPILDALGLDEHRDAGRFLVALDALLLEAGISECVLVHHMGHTNERARGDSRLRDWPDVEWKMIRQNDDLASPRYISAYGRDSHIAESRLLYDPATRALTIADGSRKDAALRDAAAAILAEIKKSTEPLSGRAIKKTLNGAHAQHVVDAALRLGVKDGAFTVEEGPNRSFLYSSVSVSQGVSTTVETPECFGVSTPIGVEHQHTRNESHESGVDVRNTRSPSTPQTPRTKARRRADGASRKGRAA